MGYFGGKEGQLPACEVGNRAAQAGSEGPVPEEGYGDKVLGDAAEGGAGEGTGEERADRGRLRSAGRAWLQV